MNQMEVYNSGANIGNNVSIIGNIVLGTETYLISIGDDTTISFDVVINTHDGATRVLRNLAQTEYEKNIGLYKKTSIGKNCFIGCRTIILAGVNIGDNCIVGAGSVVSKDLPSNTVCAGTPCKVICSIDEYKKKHKDDFTYCDFDPMKDKILRDKLC